jgi:hypothetical protein
MSLFTFQQQFPDEASCLSFLETQRWGENGTNQLPQSVHFVLHRPMLTWPMGLRSEATHGRDLISRRVTG